MATYRLSVNIISRGSGHSAIAAAAYRAEEKLKEEQERKIYDYSKKNYCLHKEILAPKGTAEKLKNRSYLWNEVERSEKRKKSQLAKEFQVSLPHELKLKQQKELVENFCKKEFVAKGMICDIAIHNEKNKNKNFHAHILTTMRNIEGESFGKKNRSWNGHNEGRNWEPLLKEYRKSWENAVNIALKKQNIQESISCLSNKERGLGAPKNKSFNYKTIRYFQKVASEIEKEELYKIKAEEKDIDFFPPAKINNKPTFKDERTKKYFLDNLFSFFSKNFLLKLAKQVKQKLQLLKENEPSKTDIQGSIRADDERSKHTGDNSVNRLPDRQEPKGDPNKFIAKLKRSSKEGVDRAFEEKRTTTREAEQRNKKQHAKKQTNKPSRSRGPRR